MNITQAIADQIGGEYKEYILSNSQIQIYANDAIKKYQWRDSRFANTANLWENKDANSREELIEILIGYIKSVELPKEYSTEESNLEEISVTEIVDTENSENVIVELNVNESNKTLSELIYDCYIHNNTHHRLVHKSNPNFIIYFVEDIVYVKNLKESAYTDLTLTEAQVICLMNKPISETNYFRFETIGYEII